jgi:hypothetical protein
MIYTVHADASGNVYTGGDFKNDAGNRFVAKNSDNATSVDGLEKKLETYRVYPNPAQNSIVVEFESAKPHSPYLFTDQSGKAVISGWLNSDKTQVDIQDLPSGNYFLNIGKSRKVSYKVFKR